MSVLITTVIYIQTQFNLSLLLC